MIQQIEINIPDGYECIGFRKPQMGELILSYLAGKIVMIADEHCASCFGEVPILRKLPVPLIDDPFERCGVTPTAEAIANFILDPTVCSQEGSCSVYGCHCCYRQLIESYAANKKKEVAVKIKPVMDAARNWTRSIGSSPSEVHYQNIATLRAALGKYDKDLL